MSRQSVLPAEYSSTYDHILAHISEASSLRGKQREITASWPMKGKFFQPGKGLMVIGRAVNGWAVSGYTNEDNPRGWRIEKLESDKVRQALVDGVRELSESTANDRWKISEDREVNIRHKLEIEDSQYDCPLSWVAEKAAAKEGSYNTNTSAFWRVSRKVNDHLISSSDSSEKPWSSHVCWSNLYKLAPFRTGNPSKPSREIQFMNGAAKLLEMELDAFRPKYVLVVAGDCWYRRFVDKLDVHLSDPTPKAYVENRGRRGEERWALAKHPQGKNEVRFVEEVIQAFSS